MESGQRKDGIVALEWERGYIEVRNEEERKCAGTCVASAAPLRHGGAGDGGHSVEASCSGQGPCFGPVGIFICPSKYRVNVAAVITPGYIEDVVQRRAM